MAVGAQPNVAHCVEQCPVTVLGFMGAIRFCDHLSRRVQPPDAENRMSGAGGVGER
jgi:hypothetical protein